MADGEGGKTNMPLFAIIGEAPAAALEAIEKRGGTLSPLTALRSAIGRPIIVIVSSDAEVDNVLSSLSVLQESSVPFGVVPWTSDSAGIRWLNKCWRPARITIKRSKVVFSYGAGGEPSHPPFGTTILTPSRPLDENLTEHPALSAEAIWMSGHSNQIDGNFGPRLLLCGLKGAATKTPAKMFPCLTTGDCFRQLAGSRDARISPAQLRCKLAVLTGCNTFPIRQHWFDPSYSLVDRLAHTEVDAVVATIGQTNVDARADLLMYNCLLNGDSLFVAASKSNEIRQLNRNHSGVPTSVKPLLVIGHPHTTVFEENEEFIEYDRSSISQHEGKVSSPQYSKKTHEVGRFFNLHEDAAPDRRYFDWIVDVTSLLQILKKLDANYGERIDSICSDLILHNDNIADIINSDIAIQIVSVFSEILSLHSTRLLNYWAPYWNLVSADTESKDRCVCGASLFRGLYQRPGRKIWRAIASCAGCGPVIDKSLSSPDTPPQDKWLPAPTVTGLGSGSRLEWELSGPVSAACGLIQDISACSPGRSITSTASNSSKIGVSVPEWLPNGSYPCALVICDQTGLSVRRDMVYLSD